MDPLLTSGILGALNLGMGALKSSQAAKQRRQEAMMRATEMETSPWSGMKPTTQVSTPMLNPWTEMAGAGLNTISQAAALEKAGLFDAKKAEDATKISEAATKASPIAKMMPSQPILPLQQEQVKMPTLYDQMYKMQLASQNVPNMFSQNASVMPLKNIWE